MLLRQKFIGFALIFSAIFGATSLVKAQDNSFNCQAAGVNGCAVYDITSPNPAPNNAVLSIHYYCDNSTSERAEVYYANSASTPVLGYVTGNDRFILKGRVSASYVIFYNTSGAQVFYNNASFSSSCRSKLAGAGITTSANTSGTLNSHNLDVSFEYNAGLFALVRDSNNLATKFQIRTHAGAVNSGSASNAALQVNLQEKFDMSSPASAFDFQASAIGRGWLMGSATNCPRLAGGSSTSDWLFLPVLKEIRGSAPAAPVVQASDGTSTSAVIVTWNSVPNATSYQVYRSETPGNIGSPIGFPVTGGVTQFNDTSALPCKTYYYSVRAINSFGQSVQSNIDSGFIAVGPSNSDSDGDGSTDAEEIADGTNACDPGQFQLHLKSPAYTKYNTFLTQSNFLELIANGNEAVDLTLTVFAIDGSIKGTRALRLAAGSQFDVDVNGIVNQRDTYGLVKIEFNDKLPGATLQGRLSNYRLDPNGSTYSFAFTKELRNPTRGSTYAIGNSHDPQGSGFLVPNWTEIVNLSDQSQSFQYNLYGQSGNRLQSIPVTLKPFGEFDLQAGHEFGEGVYLAEVLPNNPGFPYFSTVSRYSSNAKGGNEAPTYNFAFSLEGRAGNGSTQFAPTTNETGRCWTQTNWVEVANVLNRSVVATASFRDVNGSNIGSSSTTITAKSQFHFNAGALLPKGSIGSVKLDSSELGSLVAQSMVYFHDCQFNSVQTGYASQTRIAGSAKQSGTINTFLGMQNLLRLVGTTTQSVTANVTVRPFGSSTPTVIPFTIGSQANVQVSVTGVSSFPANTYGVLKIETPQSGVLAPQVLRLRENADGRADFAIPIAVQ